MSVNCIQCIKRERTGIDMLCDVCREADPLLIRIDELQVLQLVLGMANEDHPVSNHVYGECKRAVDELIKIKQKEGSSNA
jgi:hypothetical protein